MYLLNCLPKRQILFSPQKQTNPGPNVICDTLNVLGATYANCDGRYKYTDDQVDWAPERPVFKHVTKDRYVFWNAGGLGWSIGKRAYLSSGSHWHRSKIHSNNMFEIKFHTNFVIMFVKKIIFYVFFRSI